MSVYKLRPQRIAGSSAGYGGTSSTSVTIGTGSQVITTQAGLAYAVGSRLRLVRAGDVAAYLEGPVTAYSGTSLTFTAENVSGSGAHTDWNLSIAGLVGDSGSAGVKAFVLESPTSSEDITIFATAPAMTLSSVKVVLKGSSPSVTFQLHYGTDRSAAGTDVFASSQTVTGTTVLNNLTITNGAIPANGILWMTTSAASGTIDEMTLAFEVQ